MLLARENGSFKMFADSYRLEFPKDKPFVTLEDSAGNQIAELFVLSSIHPLNGRDDTTLIDAWQVEEKLGEVVFSIDASSSAWKSKTFRFRCLPERLQYEVEINGVGQIAEANYFGGYYSAQIRWGSGFFYSGQKFKHGFNPEPNCAEIYTFPAEANSSLNLTGVPLPGRDDWFFTPPPFCFGFEHQTGWIGMGIEAKPGENRYTEYQYHGSRGAFFLSLAYEGRTKVDGRYCLPAVVFDFGPDPYSLLASHVQHLRSSGLVPVPASTPRPAWWAEPIFCGWGAQNYLARIGGGKAWDYANQSSYEAFLHTLAGRGVLPGTVVLDDKWQATYGSNAVDPHKWPDLPGFIRCRHEEGQHVLLWLKAWAPEGLPVEECIVNGAGLPVAVDPTNPIYEARLRASIRQMLSPEGYDADGFKIDFSARIPSGPGMHMHGDAWGLELMRLYLGIIHDEAHKVKPDAFIITHTPHPYLADLADAIRLNDINTGSDIPRQMTHRARVAAIACADSLIDMDNWPVPDKQSWLSYLNLRPALGIPALYFATHIDSTGEALTEEDYALIRAAWADYRAALAGIEPAGKLSEAASSYLPIQEAAVKRLVESHILTRQSKPLKMRSSEIG